MKRFVKCLSVGAVLALGCDGKEDPKQPPAVLPGSLGRAEFLYECVGEADPRFRVASNELKKIMLKTEILTSA